MGTRPANVAVGQQATAAQHNLLAAGMALSSSGSYAGNNSANRAIPHGLAETPKMILIRYSDDSRWYRIYGGLAQIGYMSNASNGQRAVTTPSATNFYVGNAGSYEQSANETGGTFYWVAIA